MVDDLLIREMVEADIDAVLEIERDSFPGDAWTRKIYRHEIIENHFAHYYVMLLGDIYVGVVGMWIVIDDAQITNIAISPHFRGRKFGEKLFGFAMQKAIQYGAKRLSLEVRKSNIIAQRMYRKFGLIPGGIRKNYYKYKQEDAIVMWVNLS
ncbi:ribosomal-protein-alanine N-acetyltransferase [Cerasibacillus quisquiliarum]|uniref:[Ribosomal protein bS18]-alanine N-acetyltransferase n=1 Tax=Cerasibacillus quisquiliarum TaxID=227865 RepID=A0A511UYT8_9BACI|nr:ribosomal protein S18-alanine N-acetyltransferase [Cerasibacillus quisquiliarum]MBB5144815.1 ribosomal-protein-alanine N-acetyltransferase [Cerasibacillus quisquiliarum]GEN30292.1 putative ribosomal-protein-alanine acetyltransferase [Cerasibacillus quisquiliarum]